MLFFKCVFFGVVAVGLLTSLARAEYKRSYNPEFKIRGHVPEWIEIESDLGSIYSVDIKSVEHPFGRDPYARPPAPGSTREVVGDWVDIVEAVILGPDYEIMWYRFDCRGHAFDIQRRMARMYVPPRSVLGAIANVVCK